MPFDSQNLERRRRGDSWVFAAGDTTWPFLRTNNESEAELALSIMRTYEPECIESYGRLGSGAALVLPRRGGQPLTGRAVSENCMVFDPDTVDASPGEDGAWLLTANGGGNLLQAFDRRNASTSNYESARAALDAIRTSGVNRMCVVGSLEDPSFRYLRR
jgi:plastocyanin